MLEGLPRGLSGKEPESLVQSLGWEDALEKEMAAHCSLLAWRIPWTEEPGLVGWLQSMRSQRRRTGLCS